MTDRIFVSVWTPDLTQRLAILWKRRNPTWHDESNGAGNGSIAIPYDDPAATYLKKRNIVRFWWAGAYRFAFRINKPKVVVVDTDGETSRWISAAGPGVLDVLNDAVLYPEYGLARTSDAERGFTFASLAGDWYDPSEWVAPHGVTWTAETTSRAKDPVDWPDKTASWIWDTNPETEAPELKVVYFRTVLTVSDDTPVAIYASADNYFDLYLDGQLILSSDYDDPLNWRRTATYTTKLAAGNHVVAARVINGPKQWPTQLNPGAFLCSIAQVDGKGRIQTILRHTNTTDWVCRPEGTDAPSWRAAQVLHTFLAEAQARAVTAVLPVTIDFTGAVDSSGHAWTDKIDRTFSVGTRGVDLVEQLTELSIDAAMGPDLVLHAWKRRGTDKSATVLLQPAHNLTSYDVETDLEITTRLLVQTADGWVETAAANEPTDGRVEGLLSMSAAASDAQALRQAQAAFGDLATPRPVSTAACVPVNGATPYVDFDNGDIVSAPTDAAGITPLRVVGITVSEDTDSGNVTFVPELRDPNQGRRPIRSVDERLMQIVRSLHRGALAGYVRGTTPVPVSQASKLRVSGKPRPPDVPFSYPGALTVSSSPAYVPRGDCTLVEARADLITAGSTDTVIEVRKNGVSVGTITIAAGATTATAEFNTALNGDVDNLTIAVTAAGSGAANLTVHARFL